MVEKLEITDRQPKHGAEPLERCTKYDQRMIVKDRMCESMKALNEDRTRAGME